MKEESKHRGTFIHKATGTTFQIPSSKEFNVHIAHYDDFESACADWRQNELNGGFKYIRVR